ncbi:TPA: ABC transporter ATP-binding protein [Streptococcus suis]|nr:ABC transporter ATP-binding protein [Streptococcus suis]
MGASIDDILKNDIDTVTIKIIIYTITILSSSIIDYYQSKLMIKTTFGIELKCSEVFLHSLLKDNTNLYSKANEIVLNDIPEVSKITVQIIDVALFNTISAIFVTYFCFRIHYFLTIIIFISFPLLYFINNFLGKKIEASNNAHKNSIDELNYEFTYLKRGIPVVKSLQATDYLEGKLKALIRNINDLKLHISLYLSVKNTVFEILNYFVYLVILIVGIMLIYNNEITIGGFISFNTYSTILTKNFNAIIEVFYMERDFKVSYNRVFRSKKTANTPFKYTNINEYAVKLSNVSLRSENIEILKSITYNFPKNGLIFILGESGAGKSSFLKLIGGLISDFKGDISIDSSHSNILYLPQSPVIFKDSVYNNITLGKQVDDFDFSRMIKYLKLAGLLSKNNDNYLQSLDLVLSGGEKQRIAFARAILANPDILLLDEFDSALDDESSEELYQIIRELSKNKLILLATHDMARIENSDQCLILQEGRIKIATEYQNITLG